MSHGRPHHPDHRLHGQVVPGKDALLHCASLHGEIMMIMMVVVVVVIDDDGDLVTMMTNMSQYIYNVFLQGVSVYISTFSMTAIALDRFLNLKLCLGMMHSMPANH